mmetsp:Transcript_65508/g.175197  ORF Transcript_65508/g.175197 Transcript_65508/m.175197 type:complete len:250 (-) Transcript_65508:772-1521(-)
MRSWFPLFSSSSCFASSASLVRIIFSASCAFWSILFNISWWISSCFRARDSSMRTFSRVSEKRPSADCPWFSCCFWSLSWLACTLSSSCWVSLLIRLSASSTFLRRVSASRRRAEAMSRTVFTDSSWSSFVSFHAATSTLLSSLCWVWSRTSAMSSDSWWQRSCASCKLCDTSSIQASWAFRASCMSPMSRRMVEISAVTVASTRCLEVMIECVESTRARISSRSTFTASMAAVKSSMSRSQASTMRLT